jgi:hypothetical protein
MNESIPHIDTIPNLSSEHRKLLQGAADSAGAHGHLQPGDSVGVVYERTLYRATVSQKVSSAPEPDNPCPPEFCAELAHQIQQYCRDTSRPPGFPVPMIHNGKLCYCFCR